MAFRFVHTADIHLDSPLRSLSLRNAELAELIGDATRQALAGIVELCLSEQVDALIIAGDLYDGEQTSMKTARFLATQMKRLHDAGIAVYKVRGNHDALSKITQELVLPPTVKVFGGRAETVVIEGQNFDVAMHGLSFSRPLAPESLLPKYKVAVGDAFNIGIMHTSLDGSVGHSPYAPCTVADLQKSGFGYWALGHIHQRAEHRGAAIVVMPGMPQGRDINEAGTKTVSLVTIADDRSVSIEERATGIASFKRVTVDLTGVTDWRMLVETVESALADARQGEAAPHLVARLKLVGETPLAFRLRRDRDLLQTEAEQRAEQLGRTWIEKLELETKSAATTPARATADPVIELAELMRTEVIPTHAFRDEVRQMVKDLLDTLPPESRRFAGDTETDFESFIETLMDEGSQEIVARLRSEGAETR